MRKLPVTLAAITLAMGGALAAPAASNTTVDHEVAPDMDIAPSAITIGSCTDPNMRLFIKNPWGSNRVCIPFAGTGVKFVSYDEPVSVSTGGYYSYAIQQGVQPAVGGPPNRTYTMNPQFRVIKIDRRGP